MASSPAKVVAKPILLPKAADAGPVVAPAKAEKKPAATPVVTDVMGAANTDTGNRLEGTLVPGAQAPNRSLELGNTPAKLSADDVRQFAARLIAELGDHVVRLNESGGHLEVLLQAPVRGFYPAYRLEDGKLIGRAGLATADLDKAIDFTQLEAAARQTAVDIDNTALGYLAPYADVAKFDATARTMTIGAEVYKLERGKLVDAGGGVHNAYDLRTKALDARLANNGITRQAIEQLKQQVGWGVSISEDGLVRAEIPGHFMYSEFKIEAGKLVRKSGVGPERGSLNELKMALWDRNSALVTQGTALLTKLAAEYPASVLTRGGQDNRMVTVRPPLAPDQTVTYRLANDGRFHKSDNTDHVTADVLEGRIESAADEGFMNLKVRKFEDLLGGGPLKERGFNALATFVRSEDEAFGIGQKDGTVKWYDTVHGRVLEHDTRAEIAPDALVHELEQLRARKLEHMHKRLDVALADRPWARIDDATVSVVIPSSNSTFMAWGDGFRTRQNLTLLTDEQLLAEIDRSKPRTN